VLLDIRAAGNDCAAQLGALAAGFKTCLAMVHLVFATLLLAMLADLGASFADEGHHLAVPGHVRGRKPTDFRTVDIKRNAIGHGIHVGLMQARMRTVIAS
jgi:hypothetical protein